MDCNRYLAAFVCAITLAGCQTPQVAVPALPEKPPEPLPAVAPITLGPTLAGAQSAVADLDAHADVALSPPPPPVPDLWRDLRRAMHLPLHLDHARVQQELRWLKRHPHYLTRLQPRLQRYLPYLYTQTQLRGMPAELALLPIVESALDTFAFSHGGAAGPWQFVRGTARQYGLDINEWYDGRRDIIASTDAALRYLSDLHNRFDDWYLALAGYNAGQGNVNRALRKNPGAGFFDLRLPRETKAYVPRLLALAAIVKDPAAHGLTLPEVVPATTFYALEVHSQFQMNKLADTLAIGEDELYQFNPAINQWATPPRGPHRIIVPGHIDPLVAQAAIDEIPANARVDWAQIVVRSGDTLSQIARRHGTDVTSLRMANNLPNSSIRAGKKLLIPKHAAAMTTTPRSAKGAATYVVQNGDSLWSIAKNHNVSLNSLMRNNHLGPKDTLAVGHKLSIPGSSKASRKVTRKVRYRVRRGDSLSRIASKFNVSVGDIANWNNLDAQRFLQPGQGLLLYVNVVGG